MPSPQNFNFFHVILGGVVYIGYAVWICSERAPLPTCNYTHIDTCIVMRAEIWLNIVYNYMFMYIILSQ